VRDRSEDAEVSWKSANPARFRKDGTSFLEFCWPGVLASQFDPRIGPYAGLSGPQSEVHDMAGFLLLCCLSRNAQEKPDICGPSPGTASSRPSSSD
jgi:hypothetical protein